MTNLVETLREAGLRALACAIAAVASIARHRRAGRLEALLKPTVTGPDDLRRLDDETQTGTIEVKGRLLGRRRLACTVRRGQLTISDLELGPGEGLRLGPIRPATNPDGRVARGLVICPEPSWHAGAELMVGREHLAFLIAAGTVRVTAPRYLDEEAA